MTHLQSTNKAKQYHVMDHDAQDLLGSSDPISALATWPYPAGFSKIVRRVNGPFYRFACAMNTVTLRHVLNVPTTGMLCGSASSLVVMF